MTLGLSRYDALLHDVYDSALAPERWPATLAAIAAVFDARSAVLWTFMHGVEQGGLCFTHRLDQRAFEAYASVNPADDPFVSAVLARGLLLDGAAYRESEIAPRERVLASRLYRELWASVGIAHVGVGFVFAGTDGKQLPVAICLYRSARDLPFDDGEIALLRRLLAHLSRALGVMFHLQDAAHRVSASRSALDRLGAGVVLLDALGGVQFANTAAERLLAEGSIVRRVPQAVGGRPAPALADRIGSNNRSASVRATFAKAIDAAIAPYLEGDAEHYAAAVVLPDQDGKPAIVMNAAPLGSTSAFALPGAPVRAIVFFSELNGRAGVTAEPLRRVFGMTPAEADAALQLLEGGTAADMAARSGVSVNTFKTHLKAAFAKTQTCRQSGLLRLMLSFGKS